MTGEITLTGQVLPVGGLKEKALAAQRARIKRMIVPSRNEADIAEIPKHELGDLEFVYVEEIGRGSRRRHFAYTALSRQFPPPPARIYAPTRSLLKLR